MGNQHDVAESLKTKIRDYIREKDRISFGDLKTEFCRNREKESGIPLMSKRTFVKYLKELVEEERISRRHDKNSQKVFYFESPDARMIELTSEMHEDYLKSIKSLDDAKRYCEVLWLMNYRDNKALLSKLNVKSIGYTDSEMKEILATFKK